MTSLYTSYYTRQLALRPESVSATEASDAPKTRQPAVPRRTVDPVGPYLSWLEALPGLSRFPWSRPALSPGPAGALELLPSTALGAFPASGAATTFAAQAPSKTRSSVNALCWTPDGRRCLSGTHMGEFTLWDGVSFQFESILQAHEAPVRAMSYTHVGSFLASADDRGTMRYWRPNFELVKSTKAHEEPIRSLTFARSDLKLASASDDGTVRIWDFARVICERVLSGHGGDVRAAHWHPEAALIASGAKDGLVKVWDARQGGCAATLHAHRATVTAVEWGTHGPDLLLSAGRDAACRVWDARYTKRALCTLREPLARDITAASWHPLHEGVIVAGTVDGTLRFWLARELKSDNENPSLGSITSAHESSVWALKWHPAGHLLASGGADFGTKFWCRRRPGDPFFEQQQQMAAQRDQMFGRPGTEPVPPGLTTTSRSRPPKMVNAPPGLSLPPGLDGIPGLAGAAMTAPVRAAASAGIPGLAAAPLILGLGAPKPSLTSRGRTRLASPAVSDLQVSAGVPESTLERMLEQAMEKPQSSEDGIRPASKRAMSSQPGEGKGMSNATPWHGEAIHLPRRTKE